MFMDPGIRGPSVGPTSNSFRYVHGGNCLIHDLQQDPLTSCKGETFNLSNGTVNSSAYGNNLNNSFAYLSPAINPLDPSYFDSPALSLSPSLAQQLREMPLEISPNLISTLGADNSLAYTEIVSDINLGYISKMILEEDMEDKGYMHQGDSDLVAADKQPSLFPEMLTSNDYLSSPSPDCPSLLPDHVESPGDSSGSGSTHYDRPGSGYGSLDVSDNACGYENHRICGPSSTSSSFLSDLIHPSHPATPVSFDHSSRATSTCFKSGGRSLNSLEESLLTSSSFPENFLDSQPHWQSQFKKGVEEATKFLPDINALVIGLGSNQTVQPPPPIGNVSNSLQVKEDKNSTTAYFANISRGRKNPYHEDEDCEDGRSVKQSAVVYAEETVHSPLFDKVLLCSCKEDISKLRETLKFEVSKNARNGATRGGSGGGRSRGKKNAKKEVIDLRTLLIHCAQSVAADDRRSANELLKQIRQHGDKSGDAPQRLALIVADGLEARLAGNGTQIYQSLMAKRESVLDVLKAYHLYSAVCPFKKISHYFANTTTLNVSETATTLHIIDFGIYFGFQWPCLIQRLSMRPGGNPPKLRVTGIELPQPGFRPAERIEQTGRRLEEYCKMFNVPFQYHPIAATKWETIRVEDLKIKKDEVVVVNCLYRFRNMIDETVLVDSPRNMLLNNIRKMNPNVFILGVINGTYSAPFFVTRFREVLFHYSALFDLIDTTVPRDKPERMLIERELFGREIKNVVACEGSERVERPETYKQWQVRIMRAGFKQLPLDPTVVKNSKEKVRSTYHKDFLIDEDNKWLLQGWKGRITYALSTWTPTLGGL